MLAAYGYDIHMSVLQADAPREQHRDYARKFAKYQTTSMYLTPGTAIVSYRKMG
jgi:hypothetical protein